jgi:putative sigma-54 modulation protein
MMEMLLRNADGNVPKRDREYATKKLGKLDRYFSQANRVEMVHRQVQDQHIVEVTVFADGYTIRGEERDASLHAAIDKVADHMEIRLSKLKKKLIDSHRKKGMREIPPALLEEVPETVEEQIEAQIKERKQFVMKPMSLEEAVLQMELLGHPFFVFKNMDTGLVEVIYRRRDGFYGLIEQAR